MKVTPGTKWVHRQLNPLFIEVFSLNAIFAKPGQITYQKRDSRGLVKRYNVWPSEFHKMYRPATEQELHEIEVYGRILTEAGRKAIAQQTTSLVDMTEARHGFDSMLRSIGLEGGGI
ncbi:MAG: hypothetical protein IT205_06360 [Fimbriimonadaceae bacterium]|nr:hypothetical protein [Fimbriimonadaceae bacterium]